MKLRTKIATLLLTLFSLGISAYEADAQVQVTVKHHTTRPVVVRHHVYKPHYVKPYYGYKRKVHYEHKVRHDNGNHYGEYKRY